MDLTQTLCTDSVEGLGQVDVCGEQFNVLILAFLLQRTPRYYAGGPALFLESALALWYESLFKVCCEAI